MAHGGSSPSACMTFEFWERGVTGNMVDSKFTRSRFDPGRSCPPRFFGEYAKTVWHQS